MPSPSMPPHTAAHGNLPHSQALSLRITGLPSHPNAAHRHPDVRRGQVRLPYPAREHGVQHAAVCTRDHSHDVDDGVDVQVADGEANLERGAGHGTQEGVRGAHHIPVEHDLGDGGDAAGLGYFSVVCDRVAAFWEQGGGRGGVWTRGPPPSPAPTMKYQWCVRQMVGKTVAHGRGGGHSGTHRNP